MYHCSESVRGGVTTEQRFQMLMRMGERSVVSGSPWRQEGVNEMSNERAFDLD